MNFKFVLPSIYINFGIVKETQIGYFILQKSRTQWRPKSKIGED